MFPQTIQRAVEIYLYNFILRLRHANKTAKTSKHDVQVTVVHISLSRLRKILTYIIIYPLYCAFRSAFDLCGPGQNTI